VSTKQQCPDQDELLSFVDADLPPEQLERIERHLERCAACAATVSEFRSLIDDVAAPLPAAAFDVAEHVGGVMKRLDAPRRALRPIAWSRWGGGFAVAAGVALALTLRGGEPAVTPVRPAAESPAQPSPAELVARGGPGQASLSRDIGVQLYGLSPTPDALASGSRIRAGLGLTAGLRNLGKDPTYLLLFGVDEKHVVHWIAPEYTVPGSDPIAATVAPSPSERLLPTTAVFDDLAPGTLRVIAVITREPTHVSDVEKLGPGELHADGLLRRFPRAEIRQFLLVVGP
jgi:hypothetical protein